MTDVDYSTIGGYGPESLPGHSGSETSEAAARRPGIGPKTMEVHWQIARRTDKGMTCKEVEHYLGLGHGAASASLTRLHRAGLVARLTEKRQRQQVYVLPEHVGDREESPYRPNAAYREDRRPMALERPEPTLESIIEDCLSTPTGRNVPIAISRAGAELIAPAILEIVEKYR